MLNKALVFDIFSDYGCFKKPWSTNSPLSYPFPPFSAVCGILGAIVGCRKKKPLVYSEEEYLKIFSKQNFSFAVAIRNSDCSGIDTISFGINMLNTKEDKKAIGFDNRLFLLTKYYPLMGLKINAHTMYKFSFLKQPKYRIYVICKNPLYLDYFERLCSMVKEHKSVYSINMGTADLLADFEYVGMYDFETNTSEDFIYVSSFVRKSKLIEIKIEQDKKYMREELFPVDMTLDRIPVYDDIIFEVHGKPFLCKVNEACYISGLDENVVFY